MNVSTNVKKLINTKTTVQKCLAKPSNAMENKGK